MQFVLRINTDNAAFGADAVTRHREVISLLQKVREQLMYGESGGRLLDTNGNSVGDFGYEDETHGDPRWTLADVMGRYKHADGSPLSEADAREFWHNHEKRFIDSSIEAGWEIMDALRPMEWKVTG